MLQTVVINLCSINHVHVPCKLKIHKEKMLAIELYKFE